MILLGYLAMVVMGLLPLAGVSNITESSHRFLLPDGWALLVAFAIGFTGSYLLGRALGLIEFSQIDTYEERRDTVRATALVSRQAMRRRMSVARASLASFR